MAIRKLETDLDCTGAALRNSPTIETPVIGSFVNAQHDHEDATGGGTLTHAAISDFDTQVRTSRLDQMAAPTAAVSMNSQRITNVADPTSAQDAATKAYVDGLGPSYTDDDVLTVLTDSLEDGWRLRWDVEVDSLGTHFYPDVVMENEPASYASDIAIDLSRPNGDRIAFTLTGSPTLTASNYGLGSPARPGKLFRLVPTQDATGGHTINFAGSSQAWVFPDGEPAIDQRPNASSELEFLVTSVSPPTFTFVRAIHCPRRIDLDCGELRNPVAYWLLNEASGTRADSVGSRDFSTINGSPGSVAGKIGNGVSLTDTSTIAADQNIAPLVWLNADFSVALWVKVTTLFTGTFFRLASKNSISNDITSVELQLSSSKFKGVVTPVDGAGHEIEATANNFGAISTDTWYFVALRWTRSTRTLSLSVNNGTANTVVGNSGYDYDDSSAPKSQILIGGQSAFVADECGLWDVTLTSGELTGLYASDSGRAYSVTAGPATLDWSNEINYITLESGAGDFIINLGDVLPSKTIRLAVDNTVGATGSLTFAGVDFGDEAAPSLPASGTYDLYELTAIDASTVVGRTLQTGLTP